ncbi:metallophosphoesterase family protein [Halorhodospira halophila]|uniref:metallophosphoesterase family protein n=1 Tax=Halorhodospira halophila TaxID=1053 RepID=UPI001911D938|nr:metallophosphoesterase [Halorhodospira halophila]MBK5936396.1 hypothetical protein [Halorhodospira halophila]
MMRGAAARLMLIGDPHGGLEPLQEAYRQDVDAVVVLGDLGLTEPLRPPAGAPPICYIPGNHDADHSIHWRSLEASSAESLHGRVASLGGGCRVAGLGGVFRGRVWRPEPPAEAALPGEDAAPADYPGVRCPDPGQWPGELALRHRASIWPQEFAALRRQHADLLVLHEAPAYHRYGFRVLDDLAESLGVSLVVHGHHHGWSQGATATRGVPVVGVALRGVLLAVYDGSGTWRFERIRESQEDSPNVP